MKFCRVGRLTAGMFIAFLATFLIFSSTASASQINTHEVSIEISKDVAHFYVDVEYDLLTTDKAYYLVLGRISNLRASDSIGPLFCTIEGAATANSQIVCEPNEEVSNATNATTQPLGAGRANYTIHLEFDVFDLVSKADGSDFFRYRLSVAEPTTALKVHVKLPEGTGLIKAANPYTPEDARLGSTGRQVTLDWDVTPNLGLTYIFQVYYEPLFGIPFTYDYLYGVIAVIVVLIIYFWFIRGKSSKTQTILSVLREPEKVVLEAIFKRGDGVKQRDIVKDTSFSKATVSRIIAELENRGLIKTKRTGRTNKIFLIDRKIEKMKIPRPEKKVAESEEKESSEEK